ncbi:MAG TPA: hypothetical protein VGL81_17730 [Polyangiaceae bacterium]|jgi:hypothetical protein
MWEPEASTRHDLRAVASNDAQSRPTVRPPAKAAVRPPVREQVACDLSRDPRYEPATAWVGIAPAA